MLKPVSGTWFEFWHHNQAEGKYWNNEIRNFTKEQWEEKVDEIASLNMKYIVLMATGLKYPRKKECYFETDIFPFAKMKCSNPIEALLNAADRNNIKVFISCGFYGIWNHTVSNITSNTVTKRAFKAMEILYERYGHHKSFYGWYFPDETCIRRYFRKEFINYVNTYSEFARKLSPEMKILIAPYGTQFAMCDEKYVKQLKSLNVDIVAYQDEIGVRKSTTDETVNYYRKLREAHNKANGPKLWADMEIFEFEDRVYKSALIPAKWERIEKQLESISPYVDEVLCYQYQGMMNKPNSNAFCGHKDSERLYNDVKKHNEKYGG